jgi:methyltransferase (TIGR00027 family)
VSGRRSLIAGANAWFRARESVRLVPERILEDPWAQLLADRDPRLLLVRGLRHLLPPLSTAIAELLVAHCVRHRALDQLLLAAIGDGFRQVVVVGAGYDMRAFRFAGALEGVAWIEIDDPWTQARKLQLLNGIPRLAELRFASTDLERERVSTPLARAGFDPSRPTCYLLEGLIHYLSPASLGSLLAGLAESAAPARILLSFIDARMGAHVTPGLAALFALMGEHPRSLLNAPALADQLSALGYRGFRAWSLAEQIREFVPPAVVARRHLEVRWWQSVAQADSSG